MRSYIPCSAPIPFSSFGISAPSASYPNNFRADSCSARSGTSIVAGGTCDYRTDHPDPSEIAALVDDRAARRPCRVPAPPDRVRTRRERPTDDAAREEVQDCGRVVPAPLRPNVCYVAAPDSIRCIHHKLPIQAIRNVHALDGGSLVGVAARLFADQPKLGHQSTDLETSDGNALLAHHSRDAAAAR